MCEPILYLGIKSEAVVEFKERLREKVCGGFDNSPVYDGNLLRVVQSTFNKEVLLPWMSSEAKAKGLINRYFWRFLRNELTGGRVHYPSWKCDDIFRGPVYMPDSSGWCGKKMEVILGTNQIMTKGNLFGPVMNEMGYARGKWIAGHILNAKMGGEAVLENLVPLTSSANRNHCSQVETPVKELAQLAHKWTKTSCEEHRTDFIYRVYYSVEVSEESFEPMFCTKKIPQVNWPPRSITCCYKLLKFDAWSNKELEMGDYEKEFFTGYKGKEEIVYIENIEDENDKDDFLPWGTTRREGSLFFDRYGRPHMHVNTK